MDTGTTARKKASTKNKSPIPLGAPTCTRGWSEGYPGDNGSGGPALCAAKPD